MKASIFKETTTFRGGDQHAYVLSKHREFEEEITTLLKAHHDSSQPLYASLVKNLIRTLIEKKEPSLLKYKSTSGFRVFLPWTHDFVRTNLDWSFRKATRATKKLPSNWEHKGLEMVQ